MAYSLEVEVFRVDKPISNCIRVSVVGPFRHNYNFQIGLTMVIVIIMDRAMSTL